MTEERLVISLTGHRPNKTGGYDYYSPLNLAIATRIRNHLLFHLQNGKRIHAISGMALGSDTIFALVVLKLKKQGYDITLEAAIPCADHSNQWPEQSQKQWHSIVLQADKVTYVSNEPYRSELMQKRNEYMVDCCHELIAIWNGSIGGTFNCVRYARKKNVPIVIMPPLEPITSLEGNLLTSDCDVILHQANCFSTMGSGIAEQIKYKFPQAYEADFKSIMRPEEKLGKYTSALVENNGKTIEIVNLYGQYNYGRGAKQTDEQALRSALFQYLKDKQARRKLSELKIGIPDQIGCVRGGGDWDEVKKIFADAISHFNVSIYAYKFKG
ncbi:SLOG family protein [Cytobacillus oceanisediminis]|uniref:SLOG family protein n=1 Tax=Cytobacillus oceanisediminis TaxID=665099 RepID=UPI001FB34AE2|nr:SLOG family protein [Cytobacillus oceanisediminis]UOE58140.1 DUF1273 family protein [Cytobacillus oceanisediminis]